MRFTKYHINCHDIILLDGMNSGIEPARLPLAHLCDRRAGVGAETVAIVSPSHARNSGSSVLVRAFTADGNERRLCADSIMAAARFCYDGGHVRSTSMTVETPDGYKSLLVSPSQAGGDYTVTVDLGGANFQAMRSHSPFLSPECITLGDDFYLLECETPDAMPTHLVAADLSVTPDNPAHVGFVVPETREQLYLKLTKFGSMPGDNVADSTGAAAAAALMIHKNQCARNVIVRMDGGDCIVYCDNNAHFLVTAPVGYGFTGQL